MLKVWLPLDGDLRNLGASNIEVVNNGATVDNAGKIGKCYYFDGNGHYLQLSESVGNLYSGDFSWAVWLKPTDSTRSIISSEYASTGSSNVAFELSASRGVRIYWNGSPDIYPVNSTLPINTWTHVAITKTTGTIKTYLNGQLTNTYTGTLSDRPSTSKIRIGDDYRGGTGVSYMGYMNDWRLYDHCLSAAEVHEIAMGLVLHYKLNSMKIKTGTNLVTGVANGGRTTVLTDGRIGVQTTGENADTYFTINLSENITNGTKYFLSCDASGISEDAYWGFPLGAQNNSTLPFKIYNGHNEYSFTANDINWGSNRLFMNDISRADWANKATFWNFELYKAPALEIEDNSGYGHNGTITGSITTSSSTPRYNASTNYPDSACAITIGNLAAMVPESIFTFNIWFKKVTDEWSSKNYETILGGPSGFELEGKNGGTNSPVIRAYNWGGSTFPYTLDEWHMLTMIRTTSDTKFYLDGELKLTGSAGSIPSGNYFIGAWSNAASQNYRGYFSDARIYCTPLLDNDIKMLYNIGMKVDNLGEVHTFEFKENKNNLMWRPENARAAGLGINYNEGLGSYTQSNCQITCNSNGYRIYRPPNLTVSANGNTMYGGLKVRNSIDSNIHTYDAAKDNIFGLIKGHTYIFIISVKGQSSNSAALGISNNMGWGGGGLSPSPTNVSKNSLGNNFEGEKEIYYKFTISDDVVKTCTTSYSSFVQNNQYLSYMDFAFTYGYSDTGALGTDLYISNIGLYDITNTNIKLNKDGTLNLSALLENRNTAKIYQSGVIEATEFIEK